MKKISNRCYECRRQRQHNSQPETSDHPSYRFSVKPVAFKETGGDFFGPFEIYSQTNTAMKAYCCLFTCFTIRAVHIEVTRNLQKESCIIEFQRFFSRWGIPERIQWQRFKFHQYSKDLPGKQLHNYRATEICGVEKDYMENYSTRSTFWGSMGTPHWDEQTPVLQYRRI